jgi:hypothetical protein
MRTVAITLLLLAPAAAAWAQDTTIMIRPTPAGRSAAEQVEIPQLPHDVAEDVVRQYNAPTTIRLSGAFHLPAGRGMDGDLAVLGGPVEVGGRISGDLVVINGDLTFLPGAVVGGRVLVVGGAIQDLELASVAGTVRAYQDPLPFRREGTELVYEPRHGLRAPAWLRQLGWGEPDHGNRAGMLLALAGTYDRIEGLPVLLGPRVDLRVGASTRFQADAIAIFRTSDISFDTGDIGYRTNGALVFGGAGRNVTVGLQAYDVVAPIGSWPLKEFEVGWASFLFHRDYRDYYRRHGAGLYATWRLSPATAVTGEYRSERESSLTARSPWTLFRTNEAWRPNPAITDGRYASLVASVRYDTRNDHAAPSSGWLVTGEYEAARGRDLTGSLATVYCGAVVGSCTNPQAAGDRLGFDRMAFDARRYLRLSPSGRLNLRLAGGGWVGGAPVPLQRRLSLGFPDPLPGYGFRQFGCDPGTIFGDPALCDRVLVAQAEFRTHLGLDFGPKWVSDWGGNGDEDYEPFHVSGPDLVVFADMGRAWSVARAGLSGPNVIPADRLPALSTFKTDLGLGLDFGPLGFYLAKPLDQADRAVTFTVRMGRRF